MPTDARRGLPGVVHPKAEVVHYGGGSGKAMADRVFAEFSAGQRRFYRKHHGASGASVRGGFGAHGGGGHGGGGE